MKFIITVFITLLTLFSVAQDKELFNYINQYRVGNGLDEIKWDNKLSELSITQNKKIVDSDSLFHSRKNTYENLVKSEGIPHDLKLESKFKKFCKKYFNYDYSFKKDVKTEELHKICKMYIVFMWDNSKNHRDNLLRDEIVKGSVDSYISSDFEVVSNTITIGGVTKTFSNTPSHYKIKFYATLNMDD
jgi:hypothetical protein